MAFFVPTLQVIDFTNHENCTEIVESYLTKSFSASLLFFYSHSQTSTFILYFLSWYYCMKVSIQEKKEAIKFSQNIYQTSLRIRQPSRHTLTKNCDVYLNVAWFEVMIGFYFFHYVSCNRRKFYSRLPWIFKIPNIDILESLNILLWLYLLE